MENIWRKYWEGEMVIIVSTNTIKSASNTLSQEQTPLKCIKNSKIQSNYRITSSKNYQDLFGKFLVTWKIRKSFDYCSQMNSWKNAREIITQTSSRLVKTKISSIGKYWSRFFYSTVLMIFLWMVLCLRNCWLKEYQQQSQSHLPLSITLLNL